jgi:hypothetical protein
MEHNGIDKKKTSFKMTLHIEDHKNEIQKDEFKF